VESSSKTNEQLSGNGTTLVMENQLLSRLVVGVIIVYSKNSNIWSLMQKKKKTDATMRDRIHTEFLEDLFHLAFPQEAFFEFEELKELSHNTI
jgi:hypothetical protein